MKLTPPLRTLFLAIFFIFAIAVSPAFAIFQEKIAGVNKELKNGTGQTANNIEILLVGNYSNVNHWDGHNDHLFTYTETHVSGNTLLTWSNPINRSTGQPAPVLAGQSAHIGFLVSGIAVRIQDIFWSYNSQRLGCVTQVSIDGLSGRVIYLNNILHCAMVSRLCRRHKYRVVFAQGTVGSVNPAR